jgi:hypothetical protein
MEIRDEDLEVVICGRCKGEKRVWDPPDPNARGWRQEITCPDCSGRGVTLTPLGSKLFEFIRRVSGITPIQ